MGVFTISSGELSPHLFIKFLVELFSLSFWQDKTDIYLLIFMII